jgi:Lysozyme like domain
VNKAQKFLAILAIFGVAGAIAYWLYLYIVEGSAPSFGDLFGAVQGGFTSVTGIGKLSFAEIQTYASNAGFSGDDLNTACAIALAESSGNPNAVGDLTLAPTNGPAIGLWQINSAKHKEYTTDQLRDPQTNANEAYAIYSASGFSAWTTYNSGAYAEYLPEGVNPDSNTQAVDAPELSASSSSSSDDTISYDDGGDFLG